MIRYSRISKQANSGLSLIMSKKNKCSALKWREKLGQCVLGWSLTWETFDSRAESVWTKRQSNGRSTISPLSACVKLMLWEWIAATERTKKILLPELHRWWRENKSFWGRHIDSFKNPHKPDESGTAGVDAPCLSDILTWWKGEEGEWISWLTLDDALHLKSCSSF